MQAEKSVVIGIAFLPSNISTFESNAGSGLGTIDLAGRPS
jgi:hypothetical protein